MGDTRPRQVRRKFCKAEDLDKSQPCETSRNVYLPRGSSDLVWGQRPRGAPPSVSWCGRNRLPRTTWLKIADIYSLTVLDPELIPFGHRGGGGGACSLQRLQGPSFLPLLGSFLGFDCIAPAPASVFTLTFPCIVSSVFLSQVSLCPALVQTPVTGFRASPWIIRSHHLMVLSYLCVDLFSE